MLCITLATCLVTLSPGLGTYTALAKSFTSGRSAAAAPIPGVAQNPTALRLGTPTLNTGLPNLTVAFLPQNTLPTLPAARNMTEHPKNVIRPVRGAAEFFQTPVAANAASPAGIQTPNRSRKVSPARKTVNKLTSGLQRFLKKPAILKSFYDLSITGQGNIQREEEDPFDPLWDKLAEDDPQLRSFLDQVRSKLGRSKKDEKEKDPAKDKLNQKEQAITELIRLRHKVRSEDAPTILNEQLSGAIGDRHLQKDVTRVMHRLLKAAGLPPEAGQVFIGNSMLPNAFTTIPKSEAKYFQEKSSIAKAFRISNTFLSLGLLRSLDDEHQLAFIIAHEIQHNLRGHLKGNLIPGSHQFLGFIHEYEADTEALKLMAKAGYEPEKGIDTLYSLDREYNRLEKKYSMLKSDKDDLSQSLQRLRDVHPHSDLRRAYMTPRMPEAKELYVPQDVPQHPLWMQRRNSAQRPSHLDRFENRVMKVSRDGVNIEKRIHQIEGFVKTAKANATMLKTKNGAAKAAINFEKYIVIEEAYREIIKDANTLDELRLIELSIVSRMKNKNFPSRNLRSQLITKQLDMIYADMPGDGYPNLDVFLDQSALLSVQTRRAGLYRALGDVKTREHWLGAIKAINRGAETMGLDLQQLFANQQIQADDRANPNDVVEEVSKRLWRATRRMLTLETGEPAKPEQIIDALLESLSPAWFENYLPGFAIEVLESAMGPEEFRSSQSRPSELYMRLGGIVQYRVESDPQHSILPGLSRWANRHYTPLLVETAGGKIKHRYEKYSLQGLSPPRVEDQLDIANNFATELIGNPYGEFVAMPGQLTPPFIELLRRNNQLDPFLKNHFSNLTKSLEEKLMGVTNDNEREGHISGFRVHYTNVMAGALYGIKDIDDILHITKIAWTQMQPLFKTEAETRADERKVRIDEIDRSEIADAFFQSMGLSMRYAITRADMGGVRPSQKSFAAVSLLVNEIDAVLRPYPGHKLVLAHAKKLGKNLNNTWRYMNAYHDALPASVDVKVSKFNTWRDKANSKWVITAAVVGFFLYFLVLFVPQLIVTAARLFWTKVLGREKLEKKSPLEGIPADDVRPLRTDDFVHFFSLIGDQTVDAETKLMAVALLDRVDLSLQAGKDQMGRDIKMRAASSVGHWLLEDISKAAANAEELKNITEKMLRIKEMHPALLHPDMEVAGTLEKGFRNGAEYVLRNEPYRAIAKGEHPFRRVSSRWATHMMKRLDDANAWPAGFNDRLYLLDFLNSNGEFTEEIDRRIIEEAAKDPQAFKNWVKEDQNHLKELNANELTDSIKAALASVSPLIASGLGSIPMPKAQPLKIVRSPVARPELFDLLPQSNFAEKAPRRSFGQLYGAGTRTLRAYFAARKFFSKAFLWKMKGTIHLEDRLIAVLEESDRVATERSQKAGERWEKGEFNKEDRDYLKGQLNEPKDWKTLLAHEKKKMLRSYRNEISGAAVSTLLELYNAWSGMQDPILGFILDNFPEPTHTRDILLERLIKARKLNPGSLADLEGNKSYRMPNPVRMAEKQLLDVAVVQLKKYSRKEKVDLLLHMAGIARLSDKRVSELNTKVLNSKRRKLTRDFGAIRSVAQLEDYLSLIHPDERALLLRSLFYGKSNLHLSAEEKIALKQWQALSPSKRLDSAQWPELAPEQKEKWELWLNEKRETDAARGLWLARSSNDRTDKTTWPKLTKIRKHAWLKWRLLELDETWRKQALDKPEALDLWIQLTPEEKADKSRWPTLSAKEQAAWITWRETAPEDWENAEPVDQDEVKRLYYNLVIKDRDLPRIIEIIIRAYFEIMNDDEKAVMISDLTALQEVGKELQGPDILMVALKGMGVTGAKIAQVFSTHRGLIPDEYADKLEQFKDKAQNLEKMRAYQIMEEAIASMAREKRIGLKKEKKTAKPEEDLLALSHIALPEENKELSVGFHMRRRIIAQVRYLLKSEREEIRWIEAIGNELGAGSIKIVYKVHLKDGRTWVVKFRGPGAKYKTDREFEIIEQLFPAVRDEIGLDLPGLDQLLDEVKSLVHAEMDFRSEAEIETRTRNRFNNRGWLARLLIGDKPYVARPHRVFVNELIMVEEFVPVTRFADLPRVRFDIPKAKFNRDGRVTLFARLGALLKALVGPTQTSIAKRTVRAGMEELVVGEWLEPDPHTGNRLALKGWFRNVFTRLAIIDLGQGVHFTTEKLLPLIRVSTALEAGDAALAAELLSAIVEFPESDKKTPEEIKAIMAEEMDYEIPTRYGSRWNALKEAARAKRIIETIQRAAWLPIAGLIAVRHLGIIERISQGLLALEANNGLIKPEYAPLQKALILYSGYAPLLPTDYLYKSLERAAMVRLLRDAPSKRDVMKLGIRRFLHGRASVAQEIEPMLRAAAAKTRKK